MLSRVAENLYWLGRYLERAENIARMARVEHEVMLESGQEIWHSLVSTTASNQLFWDQLVEIARTDSLGIPDLFDAESCFSPFDAGRRA